MNLNLFSAFLLITFVLVIVPGPIVTLVISTGATRGTRAALITVVGSTVGNAILITGIALGLSIVIQHAATIFEYLRWIGAAYLVWLGIQAWRRAGEGTAMAPPRGHVYFRRGFLGRSPIRRPSPSSRRSCRSSSIRHCRRVTSCS